MHRVGVCVAAFLIMTPLGCGDDDAGATQGTSPDQAKSGPPTGPLPKPGDRVMVSGPHGEIVRCEDGKPLKVKEGSGPGPSLREAAAAARRARTSSDGGKVKTTPDGGEEAEVKGFVPRCGPDGKVIWVTRAEDPLRDDERQP